MLRRSARHGAHWAARFALLLVCAGACAGAAGRSAPGAAFAAEASDARQAPTAEPASLGLELAPDPALQRLIDPRPEGGTPVWLGGDVAASIALSPQRAVWLFGDTIVGRVDPACAAPRARCAYRRPWRDAEASVLANSAGAMRFDRRGRPAPLVKQFRDIAGRPAPVLAGRDAGELWWPLAGARVGRGLVVAVSVHRRESGLVPLENLYLRVRNPGDPPRAWRYDSHRVPNARVGLDAAPPLTWTTALVPSDGFIYAFGQLDVGFRARTVVSRLARDAIDRPGWRPRPEYWLRGENGAAPAWSNRFDLERLQEIDGLPGTSEATFERAPDLGWVTFQIPPLGFEIHAYTAPDLLGPWRDRGVVYRVPAPWSTTPRLDCFSPQAGCGLEKFAAYAVKSHPELAPAGGFALTYNVNLLFGTLATAVETAERLDDFYVPQVVAGVVPPSARRALPIDASGSPPPE